MLVVAQRIEKMVSLSTPKYFNNSWMDGNETHGTQRMTDHCLII